VHVHAHCTLTTPSPHPHHTLTTPSPRPHYALTTPLLPPLLPPSLLQFIRMLNHVGLPAEDMDYIYCDGPVMNKLMVDGHSRMCLFTGSQAVAEKLTADLRGRVKLEDAGFDWKILGPDPSEVDYVVWQAAQHTP